MSIFRKLSDSVFASPQITAGDIEEAAAIGVAMVINNRPDGETEGQPSGAEIEAAARAAGMEYVAIPITLPALSDVHVMAMRESLDRAAGKVLAYCRSGNRSTLLWALAEAMAGADPAEVARAAAEAGYDVAPVRAVMEAYAARGA
jgi:uncharacterized protein (TIGR01244 family)